MSEPVVSVVVPAWEVAPWIGAQVRSVLSQDLAGAFELVVVDDASSDPTGAVADEAAAGDVRYRRIRHERRVGASAARNTGVAATTAPLVAFCDGDDVVADGWLAALVAVAKRTAAVVGGACDDVALNPDRVRRRRPPLPRGALPVAWGAVPYAMGANLAVRRDVLAGLGGWDESVRHGTDVDLCARAWAQGCGVELAADAVVAYRHRSSRRETAGQSFRWGVADSVLARRHRAVLDAAPTQMRVAGSVRRVLGRQDSLVRLASFSAGRLAGLAR